MKKNKFVRFGLSTLCLAALAACSDPDPGFDNQQPPPANVGGSNTLVMTLKCGDVHIEMFADQTPNHVQQIKTLTQQGFYNGIVFHRVIEGFMAQTGDPTGTGMGGSKLPNIKAEFNNIAFDRGIVGMARAQSNDSANSQFFIMFAKGYFLNGKYTAWGKVTKGMDCVDKINRGEPPSNPDKIISMKLL